MSNPKFADLPGIAVDEPDYFESSDLPEDEQFDINQYDEELPNEAIEKIDLNPSQAFAKFKNKVLIDTKGVDFSNDFDYRGRIGYDAKTTDWEILPNSLKNDETLIQKYQRLKIELRELYEEVNELKGSDNGQRVAIDLNDISESMKALDKLDLNEILQNRKQTDNTNFEFNDLSQEITKFTELSAKNDNESGTKDCITFSLKCFPQKMKFHENQRIVDLEQRVHQLEKLLGTNSTENLNYLTTRLQQKTLTGIAENLAGQVALLKPKNLDFIEKRVDMVLQKVNSVQTKSPFADSYEFNKKLDEVYEFVGNYDAVIKLLPNAISRFEALENFHAEASNLSGKMAMLQYNCEENGKKIDKLKSNLDDIVKNFESNYQIIKSYIEENSLNI